MRKKRTFLITVLRNSEGSSIIEFALIFPLFIATILGVMEFGLALFVRGAVEDAVAGFSRSALTGSTIPGVSPGNNRRSELRRRVAAVTFDDSAIQITTRSLGFVGASQTSRAGIFGSGNQIIQYTVNYTYRFISPFPRLLNADSSFQIMSNALVVNEDF